MYYLIANRILTQMIFYSATLKIFCIIVRFFWVRLSALSLSLKGFFISTFFMYSFCSSKICRIFKIIKSDYSFECNDDSDSDNEGSMRTLTGTFGHLFIRYSQNL